MSWLLVLLFGLALAGATLMNLSLIGQSRKALDDGILTDNTKVPLARYHVALILPDTSDSFFDGLIQGVREAASGAEAAIQLLRYQANQPNQAETLFQLCLSAHLDGVVLYEATNQRVAARQQLAQTENVVFVPVGIQAGNTSGQGFIGSSSRLQGVESGNQIVKGHLASARVGILLSPEGDSDPWDDPIAQGVRWALANHPSATVVQVLRARTGILSGEEAAQLLLRDDPTINAIVCASAPITEGAAQVLVDQGRVGQVMLIGTDESPTIDRYVDKGVIAASIVRDSRQMGRRSLEAFASARLGTPLTRAVEVGFVVRTRP